MSAGRRPWPPAAVAGLAVRAALRSRLAPVSAFLTVAVAFACAFLLSGDGSPAGSLRAALSWSVGFAVLVLSLCAVFLGSDFAGHLRRGRLVQVCAAPLRREALLAAWWAGTVLALGLLVAVAFVAVALAAGLRYALGEADARAALAQVLVARGRARAPAPDPERLRALAEAELARREAAGRLPEGLSREEAFEAIERVFRTRRRSVPRRARISWRFAGVRPQAGARWLGLRFRYQAQAVDRSWLGERPTVQGGFLFAAPGSERRFSVPGRWAAGEVHEVRVPVEVLAGGDRLEVTYVNLERRPVVVRFPEAGPEVLFPAGGFVANVLRAALALWGRLLFLAAVGLAAAAVFDRRLAVGVALWALLVASGSEFLRESLRPGVFGTVDPLLRPLLASVVALLPDLARDDLASLLAAGERVEPLGVVRSLGFDGLVRGGVVLAAGAVAFARRELGATRA
ncbi:MAG: hypothetical protein D6731_01755 [Planctomycetota bacterium]|nr:MAG: hypothetical protein D6731_01755 [Planctomycetota bacterium]